MIKELQLRVTPDIAADESRLHRFIAEEFAVNLSSIKGTRILKRSIDARQRRIFVNLKVRVYINEEPLDDEFQRIDYKPVEGGRQAIVVGAGPAGLFAALRLIEHGIKPIVLERGKNVRERKKDLAQISRAGIVDENSNYSFGEGGAGAYSDGKLYTRSKKRGSVDRILNIFCQHGASTNILADAHPHIGTDKLPRVIENMRNTILDCGGEVHFQTKMTAFIYNNVKSGVMTSLAADEVIGVKAVDLVSGEEKEFLGSVILATGHSARDVYRYLYADNVEIEAKSLAIGVRLEHPSELIDQLQYHNKQGRGRWLPAAEYSFVTQVDGRGVYSFCMCPGGFVVPAASGPEQLVVNGMSPSGRNGRWSNSGMVVQIDVKDLAHGKGEHGKLKDCTKGIGEHGKLKDCTKGIGEHGKLATVAADSVGGPLAMMEYQEELERLCFLQSTGKQVAPAQRMADFVNNRLSADLPKTSYAPGVVASPLHFWMPKEISKRLQEGFKAFGKSCHGFLTNEAMLIAIETRTSAPVRILRDHETLCHVRLKGLFPAGEGAGYAGGIVSAAIDGERCADALSLTLSQRARGILS